MISDLVPNMKVNNLNFGVGPWRCGVVLYVLYLVFLYKTTVYDMLLGNRSEHMAKVVTLIIIIIIIIIIINTLFSEVNS